MSAVLRYLDQPGYRICRSGSHVAFLALRLATIRQLSRLCCRICVMEERIEGGHRRGELPIGPVGVGINGLNPTHIASIGVASSDEIYGDLECLLRGIRNASELRRYGSRLVGSALANPLQCACEVPAVYIVGQGLAKAGAPTLCRPP